MPSDLLMGELQIIAIPVKPNKCLLFYQYYHDASQCQYSSKTHLKIVGELTPSFLTKNLVPVVQPSEYEGNLIFYQNEKSNLNPNCLVCLNDYICQREHGVVLSQMQLACYTPLFHKILDLSFEEVRMACYLFYRVQAQEQYEFDESLFYDASLAIQDLKVSYQQNVSLANSVALVQFCFYQLYRALTMFD